MRRTFFRYLMGASALLLFPVCSHSAVILTVDISDPAKITFQATGAFSSLNNSTVNLSKGITLEGFFSEVITKYSATSFAVQNLSIQTTDSVPAFYATGMVVDYASNTPSVGADLNLFGATGTQSFSSLAAAFSGWAEFDAFYFAGYPISEIGTVGNIFLGSGNANGSGQIIGQFEVIPEPSSLLLLGGGAGLVFTLLRRRAGWGALLKKPCEIPPVTHFAG